MRGVSKTQRHLELSMKTIQLQQNIPQGWKQVALGDLVSVTTGSRDANHGSPDGQYPFFTCAQKISKIDDFSFDTEAVLIAGNGDFNVKYYKGKFDAYQRTYILSNFQNTTGHFVYQKAKEALNDIMRNNQGSSVKFIKMGDLTDYEFVLPPIKEQQKIAEILGALDEDISKTQEVIETTEKLKRGLMQQLFIQGIEHTKFKETKLGKIPEEWEVKKLEQLCSKISDGVHKKPNYVPKGIPFVTIKNLTASAGISFKDLNYISEDDHKEFIKRANPEKGDVLVTKDGTLGVVRVVETESPFSIFVSVALLKPLRNLVSSYFLKYGIESSVISDQFLVSNSGSALKHIHLIDFRSTLFPLPSMDEQLKIAEILSAVDEKILVNKKLEVKLTLLKKGLMLDLLSGKVRTNI